ncbi:esterase family protein [Haloarcula sp. JP-L23]|uniref:esterase family protein n=1 Tax=Haloarcula sp. JP-L23 TaxID=2716717 RepID=UPI00140EB3D6|nr:esterase family protein [Haloarcula sp. JP-L23]
MRLEESECNKVLLPNRILNRVDQRLEHTEFDSSEAYITYVLEEVLYRVEENAGTDSGNTVAEEDVKNRLQSLGYLDE